MLVPFKPTIDGWLFFAYRDVGKGREHGAEALPTGTDFVALR